MDNKRTIVIGVLVILCLLFLGLIIWQAVTFNQQCFGNYSLTLDQDAPAIIACGSDGKEACVFDAVNLTQAFQQCEKFKCNSFVYNQDTKSMKIVAGNFSTLNGNILYTRI